MGYFSLYFWVDQGWPGCPPLSGCSAGGRPSLLPAHKEQKQKQKINVWLQERVFNPKLHWALTIKVGQFVYWRAHGLLQLFDGCQKNMKGINILWNKVTMLATRQIRQASVFGELEPQIKTSASNCWFCAQTDSLTRWETVKLLFQYKRGIPVSSKQSPPAGVNFIWENKTVNPPSLYPPKSINALTF